VQAEQSRKRRGLVTVGGILALGATLFVWGFGIEPASLSTRGQTLRLPDWPADCAGLRVAVLADVHTGSPWNGLGKLERIVEATNAAAPDLVLLAGDYVIHGVLGGRFVAPETAAQGLARLEAPLGVFAVLGNHDWWLDAARVTRALEAVSIPALEDRATPLARGACRFWLAGISDFREGAHDLDAAFAEVPAGAPLIAFTHNPDVFPEVPGRVTLTVAGHTHGGQVFLPGFGRLIVPSAFGERFAIGHVVEEGRNLFVSPGLGTSILPVRFRVPPEISLLELHPAH